MTLKLEKNFFNNLFNPVISRFFAYPNSRHCYCFHFLAKSATRHFLTKEIHMSPAISHFVHMMTSKNIAKNWKVTSYLKLHNSETSCGSLYVASFSTFWQHWKVSVVSNQKSPAFLWMWGVCCWETMNPAHSLGLLLLLWNMAPQKCRTLFIFQTKPDYAGANTLIKSIDPTLLKNQTLELYQV